MIAAAKRAEAFAPTLNEYRPARRFPINPTRMELMMETNTTTPPKGAIPQGDKPGLYSQIEAVWCKLAEARNATYLLTHEMDKDWSAGVHTRHNGAKTVRLSQTVDRLSARSWLAGEIDARICAADTAMLAILNDMDTESVELSNG